MANILFSVLYLSSKSQIEQSFQVYIKKVSCKWLSIFAASNFFSSIFSWIHLDNFYPVPQWPMLKPVVNSQFSFSLSYAKHLTMLITLSFLKYFLPLTSRSPNPPGFSVTPPPPPCHGSFSVSFLGFSSSSWHFNNGVRQVSVNRPYVFFTYVQSLLIRPNAMALITIYRLNYKRLPFCRSKWLNVDIFMWLNLMALKHYCSQTPVTLIYLYIKLSIFPWMSKRNYEHSMAKTKLITPCHSPHPPSNLFLLYSYLFQFMVSSFFELFS